MDHLLHGLLKIGATILGGELRKASLKNGVQKGEELFLTMPCHLSYRRDVGKVTGTRKGHIAITSKRIVFKPAGLFGDLFDYFSDILLEDFSYTTDQVGAFSTKKNTIVFDKKYMGTMETFALVLRGNDLVKFEDAVKKR